MDLMNLARGTIAVFLNSPAKKLANVVGIDDKRIDELYIDLANKINEQKLKSVPTKDRVILLPQCLRGENCPASQDDEGFHCKECGKCKIADIMKLAKKNKAKVFILPGGSMAARLLHKQKPGGVIGVACSKELVMGMNMLAKNKIPGQSIFLLKDGCRNTDVDIYEIKEMLENNGRKK
jgi:hypothetical protein